MFVVYVTSEARCAYIHGNNVWFYVQFLIDFYCWF